ncbi:Microphthalmia-associated transcription factor [Pseudomonas marginalis]|nr:hypothetical protein FKZ69_06955 [Pseudomonas azotoformans]TWR74198.1 hypothetical protein FIV40_02195 [Pseudomonas marginalis]
MAISIFSTPANPAAPESPALRNMRDMVRCHEDLERQQAREQKKQLMEHLPKHAHAPKIELPAEDTNRPVQFGEPKKNPP